MLSRLKIVSIAKLLEIAAPAARRQPLANGIKNLYAPVNAVSEAQLCTPFYFSYILHFALVCWLAQYLDFITLFDLFHNLHVMSQ